MLGSGDVSRPHLDRGAVGRRSASGRTHMIGSSALVRTSCASSDAATGSAAGGGGTDGGALSSAPWVRPCISVTRAPQGGRGPPRVGAEGQGLAPLLSIYLDRRVTRLHDSVLRHQERTRRVHLGTHPQGLGQPPGKGQGG
jgi:hypothetical protein